MDYMHLRVFLFLFVYGNCYISAETTILLPGVKAGPFEYRGPVFLVKETDDTTEPFVGFIVDGGIELVRHQKPAVAIPPIFQNLIQTNTTPDVQEDPEYFAVMVTPETIAQAQISRTTTITLPLSLLLIGVSAKMPWMLVLKKQNHFEYFKTLSIIPVRNFQRRRSKRTYGLRSGRLYTESRKYDLLYDDDEKIMLQDVCNNVIKELLTINRMLQPNNTLANDIEQEFFREKNSTSDGESPVNFALPAGELYTIPVNI